MLRASATVCGFVALTGLLQPSAAGAQSLDCSFSTTAPATTPAITGPDEVLAKLHVIQQPDSPLELTAVDLTGTTLVIEEGTIARNYQLRQNATFHVRNRSDRVIERIDMNMAAGTCRIASARPVGLGPAWTGRLQPGESTQVRVSGGGGSGSTGAGQFDTDPFLLWAWIERVDFLGCAYRPARVVPVALCEERRPGPPAGFRPPPPPPPATPPRLGVNAPPGAAPAVPDVVLVTYASGVSSPIRIGTGCGSWTPAFPRVPSWTPPPDELPVTAINYSCARTPDGVSVTVSVFRGRPFQREDPIATVLVTPTQPVSVVDELEAVGVSAITLSLGNITRSAVPTPTVVTASPLLEVVEVSVTEAPRQVYRFLLRNNAPKAVRTLAIDADRNGRPALSSRRTGPEGSTLIEVGGESWFDMGVPAARPDADGSVALNPVDNISVSGIVWADGTIDGGSRALDALVSDYGASVQLRRVVAELLRTRSAGSDLTPAGLRAAILALPIEVTEAMSGEARASIATAFAPDFTGDRMRAALSVALQVTKERALADLARFESAPASPGAFDDWLSGTAERYRQWIERLGSQFVSPSRTGAALR